MTKSVHNHYDSMGDFVARVRAGANDPEHSGSHNDGDTWSGGAGFIDACRMAVSGEWEINDRVDAILDDIRSSLGKVERNVPRRVFDVAGGSVNVARFLTGEPLNMNRAKLVKSPKSGRRVTILANVTASAGIKPDEMIKRGVALVALSEALRIAGIPATIYVGWSVAVDHNRTGATYAGTIQVADSARPSDRESIMFALAHPAMLRRLCLGEVEGDKSTVARKLVSGAYGYPCSFPIGVVETLSPDLHVDSHMFLGAIRDPASWIRETLRGLGVVVND